MFQMEFEQIHPGAIQMKDDPMQPLRNIMWTIIGLILFGELLWRLYEMYL